MVSKTRSKPKAKVVMSDNVQTQKIRSLERKVTKLIKDPETKYFDVSQNPTPTTSQTLAYNNNSTHQLDQIPQGTAQAQRVGDKVKPYFVTIRGTVAQVAAHTNEDTVRILLIKCKKGNGFVPNIASASTGKVLATQGSVNACWSPIQYENKTEFTILYDKVFTLDGGNTANKSKTFVINKKIMGDVEFVPGTTTPEGGSLYLMGISSTGTGANPPYWFFTSRLYYKDG